MMKGYKVFRKDWTCRGFQYEVGKTYEDELSPDCCRTGFHFCKQVKDCFDYYGFDPNNKVAKVEALGEISESGNKCSTNKIHIIREITWHEVLELANTGKACTGINNAGNFNSGAHNTGDGNSGVCNVGNRNTGDFNIGDGNSGAYNIGHSNTGDYNVGDCNLGSRNSGDCNIGSRNIGDCNVGDFNKASTVIGCFNTEVQKLKFFDKETDITLDEWRNSPAYRILSQINLRPTTWVYPEHMSDEEKARHPGYKTTGGYLKTRDNADCYSEWWGQLSERGKNTIRNIPNFDAEKFYQITGIKIEEEETK